MSCSHYVALHSSVAGHVRSDYFGAIMTLCCCEHYCSRLLVKLYVGSVRHIPGSVIAGLTEALSAVTVR